MEKSVGFLILGILMCFTIVSAEWATTEVQFVNADEDGNLPESYMDGESTSELSNVNWGFWICLLIIVLILTAVYFKRGHNKKSSKKRK